MLYKNDNYTDVNMSSKNFIKKKKPDKQMARMWLCFSLTVMHLFHIGQYFKNSTFTKILPHHKIKWHLKKHSKFSISFYKWPVLVQPKRCKNGSNSSA